jgi:hypothetical protein
MLSCLIPHELYLRNITILETSPTMVSLPEIRASNAQIDEGNLPRLAVFVGSTAGIGKAALTSLIAVVCAIRLLFRLQNTKVSHFT